MTPPSKGSNDWTLDFEDLEKKLTKNTKFLFLNTPCNPTGKMLTKDEVEKIAKILEKFPRCLVLADEVYDAMQYDGN